MPKTSKPARKPAKRRITITSAEFTPSAVILALGGGREPEYFPLPGIASTPTRYFVDKTREMLRSRSAPGAYTRPVGDGQ